MKVSYSWLKELVDIKLSPEKLGEKLTFSGLSVASLDKVGDDWVYDIEVTSNRPDWLSAQGIAREVAAITGGKLKTSVCGQRSSVNRRPSSEDGGQLSVTIEDTKDCPLYYGNLIEGVKVAPSPEWLKKKLETIGLRSINNVVDITNYCLMEYGQPLHAFDFDKLAQGSIIVRRARQPESLVLIDGSEKKLSGDVLVIADAKKPVAIAGIMGGQDTEVCGTTTNVMLESACFAPVVVRRGTRILGVASDSSYRFERGVDIPVVKTALMAATQMICELCAGRLVETKRAGTETQEAQKKIIFDLKESRDVLSLNFTTKDAKSILEKLGFSVKTKKTDVFEAIAPSFRKDVRVSQDITEEIARCYGYDKIPLTTPEIKPFSMDTPKVQSLEPAVRGLLVSMGLKEVITYGLTNEESYSKSACSLPADIMALQNPLSHDYHLLRTTLIPAFLETASFNVSRNNTDLEIFETSHVFGGGKETISLCILLCGSRRASWSKDERPYTLLDLKGILETLLDELGVQKYVFTQHQASALRYSLSVTGAAIGSLGVVPDATKRAWGIKSKKDIFIAELSLSALAAATDLKKVFKPISQTPNVYRDISVLAASTTPYAKIKELIERTAGNYLRSVALVECYQGKEVPAGLRGITVSLAYGSGTKTLTDAEVNPVHQKVLDGLVKDLSLTLR